MNNCLAEPLSRREIRKMAHLIRRIEGCEEKLFFDILHFVECTLPKVDDTFSFGIKQMHEMGECHGLTYPDRNEIHIREDVYQRACERSGRDRLTIAHELFHLLQHFSRNISFARTGTIGIKTYMDPEWQSDAFGGELLVPHYLIQNMNASDIAEKCGVSLKAANYQLSKLN